MQPFDVTSEVESCLDYKSDDGGGTHAGQALINLSCCMCARGHNDQITPDDTPLSREREYCSVSVATGRYCIQDHSTLQQTWVESPLVMVRTGLCTSIAHVQSPRKILPASLLAEQRPTEKKMLIPRQQNLKTPPLSFHLRKEPYTFECDAHLFCTINGGQLLYPS